MRHLPVYQSSDSQETAFEELRISPHEGIPEGTQRYFGGIRGYFTSGINAFPAQALLTGGQLNTSDRI